MILLVYIVLQFYLIDAFPIFGKHHDIDFRKKYSSPWKPDGDVSLTNGFVSYMITLQVGTPSQEVPVYIDTGSADLWFHTPSSLECSTDRYSNLTNCDAIGLPYFNPKTSRSLKYTGFDFNTSYVSGYQVLDGDAVIDKVTAGDLTVPNQQFGIASLTTYTDYSMMGLGFRELESSLMKYPTFIENLHREGLIDKRLYSVYLNSQFSDGGSIRFGDVDHSKYVGKLVGHRLVTDNQFYIQLDEITFAGAQILGSSPLLIDTGSTLMSIPRDTFLSIIQNLNATFNYDYGLYNVVCKDHNTTAPDLIFKFDEQRIVVGPEEYLMNYNIGTNGQTEIVQDENGQDLCFLGFDASDDIILGDTFIRSVYAVFDIDNKQVSLAKAAWATSLDAATKTKSGHHRTTEPWSGKHKTKPDHHKFDPKPKFGYRPEPGHDRHDPKPGFKHSGKQGHDRHDPCAGHSMRTSPMDYFWGRQLKKPSYCHF